MSQAYSVLQDKNVGAAKVACCPTMDIVAVLTTDHHLLVYRTVAWQRLLHVKSADLAAPMTAMTWRPDGLVLAVGHEDGKIALYDMESGTANAAMKLFEKVHAWHHTHAVTALQWTKYVSILIDRTDRFVWNPPLDASGEAGTTKYARVPALDGSRHLLVSGDAAGHVLLWAFGSVCLRRLRAHNGPVDQVFLLPDASALVVSAGRSIGSLELPDFVDQHGKIFVVAHHAREVQLLLRTVETALKQVATEWTNGTRIFEAKMRLLSSAYAKYSSFECPQAHMYTLLCTGLSFPALTNFFAQDLQEQSMQRIQKAFAHACHSMQTLIQEHLCVAATNVLFRLSELRGLSFDSTNASSPLLGGQTTAQISDLIAMVQCFILKLEQLSMALRETEMDFSLLFQWFSVMMAAHSSVRLKGPTKTNAADTKRLARFLLRATVSAKTFRDHRNLSEGPRNPAEGFEIEVTFGNPVAEMLRKCPWKVAPASAALLGTFGLEEAESDILVGDLFARIEKTWCAHLLANDNSQPAQLSAAPILPTDLGEFHTGMLDSTPLLATAVGSRITLCRLVRGSAAWEVARLDVAHDERLINFCLYTKEEQSQLSILLTNTVLGTWTR
ncbi:hypothetical protein ACHHYP_15729 [Achlya hypogyna]|uniref:Anaphase-promoting complex subunit 4 n=1 Tax=Achlya hypogyna TaxID=1202772 RepID=A0A1V9YA45_ACHHY|nr:hypothetical protein ACHHYP_15729 [Achlya hypogyna]